MKHAAVAWSSLLLILTFNSCKSLDQRDLPESTVQAASCQPPGASQCFVIHNETRLRTGPSVSNEIQSTVSAGTALTPTGRFWNNTEGSDTFCWYEVQEGSWIASQLVNCSDSTAPVPTPPPTGISMGHCPAYQADLQAYVSSLHQFVCASQSSCAIGAQVLDQNSSPVASGTVNGDTMLDAWSTVKFPLAMTAFHKAFDNGWDLNRWSAADGACRVPRNVPVPGLLRTIDPNTYMAAARGALEWSENQLSSCMLLPLIDQGGASVAPGMYTSSIAKVEELFAGMPGIQINRWRISPYLHVAPHCAASLCEQNFNYLSANGALGIMRKFWSMRSQNSMQQLQGITSLETIGMAGVKNENLGLKFYGKLGHGKDIWSNKASGMFNHIGQLQHPSKSSAMSVAYLHSPVGDYEKAFSVANCLGRWWLNSGH